MCIWASVYSGFVCSRYSGWLAGVGGTREAMGLGSEVDRFPNFTAFVWVCLMGDLGS